MKNLLVAIAFAFFGIGSAFSQGEIKLGINGGLPMGDTSDISDFNAGADITYLLSLADIVEVGGLVGYSHFFGKDGEEGNINWEVDDFQFVPIAASGRVNLPFFFIGADLGYAIGVNDGNDGGVFYRPKVGITLGNLGLVASYSGISIDEATVSTLNIGLEFGL